MGSSQCHIENGSGGGAINAMVEREGGMREE